MAVVIFPGKGETVPAWTKPQDNFGDEARDFVADSPYSVELVNGLRSCKSPFIRAAIIYCACSAEDVPFLQRIAAAKSYVARGADDD